jgi:Domain of unknown function (DUF4390)
MFGTHLCFAGARKPHRTASVTNVFVRRSLLALVAVAGMLLSGVASADDISVQAVQLTAGRDGVELSADFDVALTPRLENALHRGVALYFTTEFECTHPRWYWFDDRIVSASRSTRISFHALTRTYRLSTGALHQSFPTLGEALRVLGRVRHWTVLASDQLRPETTYVAAVRMRLDVSQLPKPFQVSALANPEWSLTSEWARWEFTTPAAAAQGGAK